MPHPIKIILPVCKSDFDLAYAHAEWLASLGKQPFTAVVAWDKSLNTPAMGRLLCLFTNAFEKIEHMRYPAPPLLAWPQAPNWAFQHIAHQMAEQQHPWLWLEADAVILRKDAFKVINSEYHRRGKSWMGPTVPNQGNTNGVCVYPSNAASRMPRAMEVRDVAWDYAMTDDISSDRDDCSDLFSHVWIIVGDEAKSTGIGEAPKNFTTARANKWIHPGSVLFHRSKDSSLVALLRGGYKPA